MPHQLDKAIKQRTDIVRARTGFGMALKTERGILRVLNALQRLIEQGAMGRSQMLGQTGFINGETVILAADHDLSGTQILHRMISPVMTEFHFDGTGTAGQAQ